MSRCKACLCSSSVVRIVTVILLVELLTLFYVTRPGISTEPQITAHIPTTARANTTDKGKYLTLFHTANSERVARVRKYCDKEKTEVVKHYPHYKTSMPDWVWMKSDHHQLFYCAVPKCGSTTWKSYLMEDMGMDWTGIDTHA